MPWHVIVRACFVAAVAWAAALLRPFSASIALDAGVGALLGVIVVLIETRLRDTEVTDLLGALIGGAIGLGLAKTIGAALFWADSTDPRVAFLHSFILLVFPYLGIVMGARKGEWLQPQRLAALFRNAGPQKRYRILDTSVIIDGRIADVCETGFLDGTLVIPQFVLNINELANALKPVVLPGEFMKVFILKEGKEYNQGVAYLDDGTMVVVDNARRMISKNIDVVVTSVLQTTAGKMIFGRFIEASSSASAAPPVKMTNVK